jgi:hypothetical protein
LQSKEEIAKYNHYYYIKNKEKSKIYYEENKEKISKYNHDYYIKNK